MTWSEQLQDFIFSEAADLATLESSTLKSVLNPVLKEARQELQNMIRERWEDLSITDQWRATEFSQTFTSMLDQIALAPLEASVSPMLQNLMVGTYAQAATEINKVLQVPLYSTTAPPAFYAKVMDKALIEGQPLFTNTLRDGSQSWWMNLRASTRDRMAREIRKSLVLGESTQQATRRLIGTHRNQLPTGGSLGVTRRQAEAVVRTSIHAVTNATRSSFYEDNTDVVSAVQSLATLDSRTTILCRSYDGLKWKLPDYTPMGANGKAHIPPPRHFRCRSTMMPVLGGLDAIDRKVREMGMELEPNVRASADGPVTGRLGTMQGWLANQSEQKQNAMLGVGRAKLWREGKVSLRQLVDNQGRTLTLTELEKVAGIRSLPN